MRCSSNPYRLVPKVEGNSPRYDTSLEGVIVLSCCGSEQKEARFGGGVPQLRRMCTQRMLRGCPQCRQSTVKCATYSTVVVQKKVTLSSRFSSSSVVDLLAWCGGERTRARKRSKSFSLIWGGGGGEGSIRSSFTRFALSRKGKQSLDPALLSSLPFTVPTFTLCWRVGYSAIRAKFPVLRFFFLYMKPKFFYTVGIDASWCRQWTSFEFSYCTQNNRSPLAGGRYVEGVYYLFAGNSQEKSETHRDLPRNIVSCPLHLCTALPSSLRSTGAFESQC